MNYIVLDLEWNQCPDGKEKEEARLPFEIIEIGAVKMDSNFTILDHFHELIHPQVYTTLHHMIKEIITVEESDLQKCRSFPEVIKDFFSWCGKDALFCIWGSLDLLELQRNLSWYKLPSPFPFPLYYYDIQKIFSILHEDRKTRRSLEYAVDYLNVKKDNVFHNAYSDALYTAEVIKHFTEKDILTNSSVDYYRTPANRRQEFSATYQTYQKFVSKPFESKTEAMKDRVVTSTRCYCCSKNARKKIRWFSSGTRNYLCLAYCEEHGWLKGKIRMRQNTDGSFYVIKTLKLISEEEAYAVKEKQEIIRLRRRLKRTFHTKK